MSGLMEQKLEEKVCFTSHLLKAFAWQTSVISQVLYQETYCLVHSDDDSKAAQRPCPSRLHVICNTRSLKDAADGGIRSENTSLFVGPEDMNK